tara:strand:- start:80 stop:688 length:609 start_codon:yes stop_codon:yes gene_type:complete
MNGFTYLWENIENNMKYIGSHKGNIDDGYIGSGVYFRRAYDKNPNIFKRNILYIGVDFLEVEGYLLKNKNVVKDKSYYNLKDSAVGGWEHCNTAEIIAKRASALSKSRKGKPSQCSYRNKEGARNPMYNKKHSVSTKLKMSEKRKGKVSIRKGVIELTEGMVFDKVIDAANYYGITQATMSTLIRGKEIKRGKCKHKIFNYE